MSKIKISDRLNQLLVLAKESPEEPFIQYAIAKEWENLGETEAALEVYQKLVIEHRNYTGTYYHFGKLLEGIGMAQEALLIYHEGIKVCAETNDQHALSELKNAKTNLELGLDD